MTGASRPVRGSSCRVPELDGAGADAAAEPLDGAVLVLLGAGAGAVDELVAPGDGAGVADPLLDEPEPFDAPDF